MIYIKDMIFAALRRWRAVLAVAVLLGLLLGGWKGLSSVTAPPDLTQQQEDMELYEAESVVLKQKLVTLGQSIKNQKKYVEESVLMQIDPFNCYEVRMSLYVETDYQIMPGMSYQNPDNTTAVLYAYRALVYSEGVLDKMAQTLESESLYMNELITVKLPEDASGTLTVQVMVPNGEKAQQMLDLLVSSMESAKDQVSSAVAQHELYIVEKNIGTRVDTSLAETQKRELNRVDELVTSQSETKTALNNLRKPTVSGTSAGAVVRQAVIFAVIGVIVGAVVTVGVLWVMHIGDSKVYSVRTLENRVPVNVLGVTAHKKLKNPIDRWLCALEGRGTEDRTEILATDIRYRLAGASSLLVTGTTEKSCRQALVRALEKAVPGVKIIDGDSLPSSAAALEALNGCDAVVLVEACGVSRYEAVETAQNLVRDYNKQLIGCVVLDG